MIINIEKTIVKKTMGKFIALMILVVVICILLFVDFRNNLIKGLDNNLLAIFIAVCYIIYAFYESFRNYNYIYFNDESDKIVLRYFPPTMFASKKNSIEIPKKDFAGYILKSFFMRYRESIVLFRNTGKGKAKYPPVSITGLNNEERNALLFSLNQLRAKNEKK
jgi:uncharacterized membrane protein YbhN (UPF0104 family)